MPVQLGTWASCIDWIGNPSQIATSLGWTQPHNETPEGIPRTTFRKECLQECGWQVCLGTCQLISWLLQSLCQQVFVRHVLKSRVKIVRGLWGGRRYVSIIHQDRLSLDGLQQVVTRITWIWIAWTIIHLIFFRDIRFHQNGIHFLAKLAVCSLKVFHWDITGEAHQLQRCSQCIFATFLEPSVSNTDQTERGDRKGVYICSMM